MRKILVVEDDQDVAFLIETALKSDDNDISIASSVKMARHLFEVQQPDLVVVDVGLPDGNGFELISEIRRHFDTPVIFVTARSAVQDELDGFEVGADDFLVKPFDVKVLRARVERLLKRDRSSSSPHLRVGSLTLELDEGIAHVGGLDLRLTPLEFQVLRLLIDRLGRVTSKELLLRQVWHDDAMNFHLLENTIHRLRKKLIDGGLPRDCISNRRGLGYRIDLPRNHP